MPFFFGDEPTNFGESTAVNCMVTKGDLPLSIHWSLNGDPLISSEIDGIAIVKMTSRLSSLNIESINQRHRGVFKCTATNVAGSVEHVAQLNVNGILYLDVSLNLSFILFVLIRILSVFDYLNFIYYNCQLCQCVRSCTNFSTSTNSSVYLW